MSVPPGPRDAVVPDQASEPAAPAIAASATAGLSPEFAAEFASRIAKGQSMPIVWNNPGAYGQLNRISDDIIYAMPPPRRPLWPMKDSYLTWRYLRAYSIVLVFVALAVYLQSKNYFRSSSARMEAERRSPGLARLLVRAGILEDLGARAASMDVRGLLRRVFLRYSDDGVGSSKGELTIPTARAAALLALLLAGTGSDVSSNADAVAPLIFKEASAAGATATRAVTHVAALPPTLVDAFTSAGVDLACPRISLAQFEAAAVKCCEGISPVVLLLAFEERFGLASATADTLDTLGVLYDRVCAARRASGANFTPQQLSDLLADAGFPLEPDAVSSFIAEYCAACATSTAPSSIAQVPAHGAVSTPVPTATTPAPAVFISRSEFQDIAALALRTSQVSDERVDDYVRMFFLLHLSGAREAAGVSSVGSTASK